MRQYKNITTTEKKLEKIICDSCGKEITKNGVDIDITADDIEDRAVNKYFGLDLCHSCAEEKLYPYLRELGAEEI